MEVGDNGVSDLIEKVGSWVSLDRAGVCEVNCDIEMGSENSCRGCEVKFSELCHKYSCQSCRKLLCGLCVRACGSIVIIATSNGSKDIDSIEKFIKVCGFCSKGVRRDSDKVYPSVSLGSSPEMVLPMCGNEKRGDGNDKVREEECRGRVIGLRELDLLPREMKCCVSNSPTLSDEEPEQSRRLYFSSTSEYYHDNSDIDISVSFRRECYSVRSEGSSPIDSPSRLNINTPRAGLAVQKPRGGSPKTLNSSPSGQETTAVLGRPGRGTGDPDETVATQRNIGYIKPLDFEKNVRVWLPPPPEDEDDEAERNYFEYDDEDDENDNGVGVSDGMFSSSSSLTGDFPAKNKQVEEHKEPFKAVIQGHFRALVSQLLQGEGIKFGKENSAQDWLDIISNLAWQAANFVKPDTSKGGSMDPVNYVKIKCIASGKPSESSLVKGIVCTKNIKHKRMTSQYNNPRLLLLGGSLEYQRAQNQLASFNTLLEEEMNHLKMIVSKIEAHRTNVLLVEKSVSSYAQEYLLEKEISLVLNVKRPLLEQIARCIGASITSVGNISAARLGQCEVFRLEKVSEELEAPNQYNRRPSKTLMYFEGCPRRLGCTVLMKGLCREELKKIKHVFQYAVFAAYHLSLETSFLADEGAHLPKLDVKPSHSVLDGITSENATSFLPTDIVTQSREPEGFVDAPEGCMINTDDSEYKTLSDLNDVAVQPVDAITGEKSSHECWDGLVCNTFGETDCTGAIVSSVQYESTDTVCPEEERPKELERIEGNGVCNDYFPATENQQSILVSFSSRCVSKGTLCERSRLLRIRYYGSFDKPLGRYLRDDLFDQVSVCNSCKEPVEAHVQCYTHRQGSLTINVRRLNAPKLPGERDGKIWMWHRCLRCAEIDGVPPATHRVIMSDAAWGLSFGKFLELSFSNHATANRVASCGHSLQRDCLRFYGFGSMVAFFHYSPIDILTVHLPPPMLECDGHSKQEWIRREVKEIKGKMETVYVEISKVLCTMEQKSSASGNGSSDTDDLHKQIQELKDLLDKERDDYHDLLLRVAEENSQLVETTFDILELNRLRRSLLIGSHAWDRQLYSLDSLLNSHNFSLDASDGSRSHAELTDLNNDSINNFKLVPDQGESFVVPLEPAVANLEKVNEDAEVPVSEKSSETNSPESDLSDKIDSAWTGTDVEASQTVPSNQPNQPENLPLKRLMAPARVYSFDSAMRIQEKYQRNVLSSHLSAVRSFHVSGDYRSIVRDPSSNVLTHSQVPLNEANSSHSFIPSVSQMAEGPRLLLPQAGQSNLVIAVYDDEPTSVISYALSSKEYENWVSNKLNQHDENWCSKEISRDDSTASTFLSWQSFGSLDLDYISYGGYGSEDTSLRNSIMFNASKKSPHLQINFDDSVAGGNVKFSVTCYFTEMFETLRKKCYRSEVDFVCSMSRCRRWSAQGGKSNVYFAKTMDERFIVKQVTKTELESFQEFAPEYFKYLNESVDSGSPTCLAKILGIFQVTIKHLKGGKEIKMDLMVMENLFFNRCISTIYDLKGSLRSRYNPDTTGANKVLLDMNLLETLRTNPIFLGSKAKRRLERAVWNDTSFLASVDVMDYSLLVGVDEERKELVIGIIDFMRQYTWDKHLETWVKASGILGGSKNASPTIISPKQYKKRFRKAMTSYFLTVPDQWSL